MTALSATAALPPRPYWRACLMVAVLLATVPARAQAPESNLRAAILLRAVAYDRAFVQRAGSEVAVAVLHHRSDRDSLKERESMGEAFAALSARTFVGLPVKLVHMAYEDAAKLGAFADAQHIDILYVCSGLDNAVAEIQTISRARQIRTITGTHDYLRAGISLGVAFNDGRPKLMVNLAASKQEGMQLGSEMLQLAEIIR